MLTTVILPLSLFIIMLGMGLSLVMDDFRRILKYPKAATVGLFNQLILLPIVGLLLANAFGLSPMLAVGLMIVAACPGGVTSNLITYVAKGDTALSISMTAIGSVVTVFTIPIVINLSLTYFMGEGQEIELPILETMMQVVGITILPISIGMYIRHKKPDFALRMEKPSRIASTVIFMAILLAVILANLESLKENFVNLSGVTLVLNIATMSLGFIAAKIMRLDLKQSLSITIESGIQNGTLAIVIATSILGQDDMALPAGVYSLIMFITGGFIMAYFGRK
jgi:BASS family bile acid:Na+ symporter